MKGSYVLIIELPNDAVISVGKLGKLSFTKGYYIYIGSALNNLEKRVKRHLSRRKKFHWHIDYFLKFATVRRVLFKESREREECKLARELAKKFTCIKGFGSSDCNCESHLFHSKSLEEAENECKKLGMRLLEV